MNSAPRVSVCVPAFNAGPYIAATISSVLAQTLTDFELLIVDDGSNDNTREIVSSFQYDPRLRLICNERNMGCSATRNRALELARGEFIAWLDADDLCAPERLQKQIAFLRKNPDIAMVGSRYTVIDESGTPLTRSRRRRQWFATDEIAAHLMFTCALHQPTMMGRTVVMQAHRYDPSFDVAEDHDLWIRMAREHRFAVLPERLLSYRQHPNQLTHSKLAAITQARQLIQARELSNMGIAASAEDVAHHDALFNFKGRRLFEHKTGRLLDHEFVAWTSSWLSGLAAANRRLRQYPEPAFTNLLVSRWRLVATKAFSKGQRCAVAREWVRSDLSWRLCRRC